VSIDGWNSMNTEHLELESISDALPVIKEVVKKNKMRSVNDGIGLYMDLILDNTTSPHAITKTILTGNLPGLIDIPKEMYFNNSEINPEKYAIFVNF